MTNIKSVPTSELVTKSEAAKLLGVSTKTIERLVERGKLVPYRKSVGRIRVYFRLEEVERLKTPQPSPGKRAPR